MKKILTLLTLAVLSFGLLAFDAEAAKRFGGGSSIGKQRESISPKATPKPAPTAAPTPAAPPAAAPASGASKWLGPLAGLAAGGLLASLFMGGAFGGIKMMDVLLLAALIGAAFFIFRMLRKPQSEQQSQPQQPLMQPMQYSGVNTDTGTPPSPSGAGSGTATPATNASIPADFQVEPFLRNAKISFIRLQAANDARDVSDIREYTTSEMFAEISMQIGERGSEPQKTEVVTVNAELLEVVVTDDLAIASVRFTGQLRDLLNNTPGAALEAFDEIWHVQKNPKDPKSVWLLAGIQQVS